MRLRIALCVMLLAAVCVDGAAAEPLERAAARLRDDFTGTFARAARDGLPFTVQASRDDGLIRSQARFLLTGVDFDRFVELFGQTRGWCQSLLLHLNVKTCVHRDAQGERLALYLGRKYYEHPDDSVRIAFDFGAEFISDAMRATLTAQKGPYGTSKYVFVLNAVRVRQGVFVELALSNEVGYAGAIVDFYLNTLGRSKVGFTRTGETIFGNPEYVRGQEGAAERNVVRYMYALRVSLELAGAPFERRAAAWFDATQRHARQLHELDRDVYLDIKRREHDNQVAFQRAADRGEVIERDIAGKNR